MFKPRYGAAPFRLSTYISWMVYDEGRSQPVALSLHRQQAQTLAHTLNVADLSLPPQDFGDDSWDDRYGAP